jgi:hypothetical protein
MQMKMFSHARQGEELVQPGQAKALKSLVMTPMSQNKYMTRNYMNTTHGVQPTQSLQYESDYGNEEPT